MDFKAFIINPNDITRILFGAGGKLSPMEFAQGLVFIVLVGWAINILSLIPGLALIMGFVGLVVGLVLAFGWVCIFSKRFHDAGKSGWLTLAAIVAAIILFMIVGAILNPIFGVPTVTSLSDLSAMQNMGAGLIVKNMVTTALVNGALGFYMFRLKAAA